jgi:hypothetical protein
VTFTLHGLIDPQIKNIFLFAGDGDFIRTIDKIAAYPGKRLVLMGADSQSNISNLLRSKAHEFIDVTQDLAQKLSLDKAAESAPRKSRSPNKKKDRPVVAAVAPGNGAFQPDSKESLFENLEVKSSPRAKPKFNGAAAEFPVAFTPLEQKADGEIAGKPPGADGPIVGSPPQLVPPGRGGGYYASDDEDKHDSGMIGRLSAALSTHDGNSSEDFEENIENISSALNTKLKKNGSQPEDNLEQMPEEEFFGTHNEPLDMNGGGVVVLGTTTWKDEHAELAVRLQNNSEHTLERAVITIRENYMGISQVKSRFVFVTPIPGNGGTDTVVIALKTDKFQAPLLLAAPISDDLGIKSEIPLHLSIRSKHGLLLHEFSIPGHIFFEDEGFMNKDDFLGTWKDTDPAEEFQISIPNCSKIFFKEELLIAHLAEISVNIVTKTSSASKGTRLFLCGKLLGQFVLMVFILREEDQSLKINCRSEEDNSRVAQVAALAVTGYLAQFQEV